MEAWIFRVRRAASQIPQEYIAKELGVTLRQVQRYEAGDSPIPEERVEKLREILRGRDV